MRKISVIAILLLSLVAAPALADCGASHDKKAVASAHECGEGCAQCGMKGTEAGKLAEGAEKGCVASMGALVAMAKDSGDQKAIALAEKAEGGCEHSKSELIALAKTWNGKQAAAPGMAQLAKAAKGGCSKSAAELIRLAKKSDDKQAADLAEKADGGCEHSKAALIALALEDKETAAVKTK